MVYRLFKKVMVCGSSITVKKEVSGKRAASRSRAPPPSRPFLFDYQRPGGLPFRSLYLNCASVCWTRHDQY